MPRPGHGELWDFSLDVTRESGDAPATMARVEFTRHLPTLFPQLQSAPLSLEAETVADVITELERIAPGIGFYICDELGRLRQHVNIFVDNEMIVDRKRLGDKLSADSRVFIAQALSGG